MESRIAYYLVTLILIIIGRLFLNISTPTRLEQKNISQSSIHNRQDFKQEKQKKPLDENQINQEKNSILKIQSNNTQISNPVISTNFSTNSSDQNNLSTIQMKEEYKNSISRWMFDVEESFKYIQSENTTIQPTEDGSLVYLGSNRDHFQINSQVNSDGHIYADEVQTPSGQSFARIYDASGRVKTYFYKSDEMNSIAVNYKENGEVESVKQYINGAWYEKKLADHLD